MDIVDFVLRYSSNITAIISYCHCDRTYIGLIFTELIRLKR
jgi:hypothetical protein